MTNLVEQLVYLNEVIETIKETGTVTLDREKDKAMIEALERTAKIAMNHQAEQQAKSDKLVAALSNDYTLSACIDYVRAKRTNLTSNLHYVKEPENYQILVREIKLLGAVDENLVAMSIMADRMAEHILSIPGNQPEEAGRL